MNNTDYEQMVNMLYARAEEVQENLHMLAQDLKASGMTDEQVAVELSFSMLHEGYRIRYLEEQFQGKTIKPNERKLQAHVDLEPDTKGK